MLFEKTEHVIGPDGASEIGEAMALLRGRAEREVDFHLGLLAGVFHWCFPNLVLLALPYLQQTKVLILN